MEEKSFGSSHVMQVIYTDDAGRPQTSYLQCKVWLCRGAPLGRVLWESLGCTGMRGEGVSHTLVTHSRHSGVCEI